MIRQRKNVLHILDGARLRNERQIGKFGLPDEVEDVP